MPNKGKNGEGNKKKYRKEAEGNEGGNWGYRKQNGDVAERNGRKINQWWHKKKQEKYGTQWTGDVRETAQI